LGTRGNRDDEKLLHGWEWKCNCLFVIRNWSVGCRDRKKISSREIHVEGGGSPRLIHWPSSAGSASVWNGRETGSGESIRVRAATTSRSQRRRNWLCQGNWGLKRAEASPENGGTPQGKRKRAGRTFGPECGEKSYLSAPQQAKKSTIRPKGSDSVSLACTSGVSKGRPAVKGLSSKRTPYPRGRKAHIRWVKERLTSGLYVRGEAGRERVLSHGYSNQQT